MSEIEELEGSELGTKAYWDKQYEGDINNFRSHGDVGDIWFGEDSMNRVLTYIIRKEDQFSETSKIVDIGCGNGMFLVELSKEGYKELSGIDYSEKGVELAKDIAVKAGVDIKYEVCDILNSSDTFLVGSIGTFDLAHDKGTYDAISLMPEDPKSKREKYIQNVADLLQPAGKLIITSCNWTQEELLAQFKGYFKMVEVVPTPTFKFGNKIGSVVTTIVLEKL